MAMAKQHDVRTDAVVQERLLPMFQGAAAITLPFVVVTYVLVSYLLAKFYEVFGITLDEAGINQTVLLGRMATVIVVLIAVIVPLTCAIVTFVWLLNWMTGGRLRTVLRTAWRQPWGQALVVMLLVVWLFLDSTPSHLPWIIGAIVALVPALILSNVLVTGVDRKTGGRLARFVASARRGDSVPWLVITSLAGIGYTVGGYALAWDERDGELGFTGKILFGSFVPVLLIAVFPVFFVPFRLLRQTRYFRIVTATIVSVLVAIVLSAYAVSAVASAARDLHDHGRFPPALRELLGVHDQKPITPDDQTVLVLGQSEDAVWVYDCSKKRTIRVAGSDVVATKLELDPGRALTC
jgi:multisubunit Na+/H+ antiporter MnhE subunit